MKRTLTSAAVAAALTLTGLSAHAGCVEPRGPAQQGAFHPLNPLLFPRPPAGAYIGRTSVAQRIVGTWHVTYTSEGTPFGEAFIQWHSDGTEWENIDFPVLGGNLCLGSWKTVDQTHVFRHHVAWVFTNGLPSGYFSEIETDEVALDGNSYRGANETKIYDVDGNLVADVTGTAAATRIAP